MEDTIGMDEPFYYRNKAQYPVGYDKGIITGFYAANSHRIIDFDNCYIGSKRNREILNVVKNFIVENNITAYDETTGRGIVRHILIREGHFTGEIMVCLIVNGSKFKYKTQLANALKEDVYKRQDWYIEMVKPRLYNEEDETREAALWTLKTVLINALKMLHPRCV